MAKGVIVVERIPELCLSCKRAGYINGIPACKEKEKKLDTFSGKPDWCPIRPMSEKMDIESAYNLTDLGFVSGWNACINEILKDGD